MKIVFFNKSIDAARKLLDSDTCVFWYTPGLKSYFNLDQFVSVEYLFIEENIFKDFSVDYPELLLNFAFQVFSCQGSDFSSTGKICFFASNDTMLYSFLPIIKLLPDDCYELIIKEEDSSVESANRLALEFQTISHKISNIGKFSLLVVGNDWGILEQRIINDFTRFGINSVCLQESSIDFNPKDNRMRFCGVPLFQGVATLANVNIGGLVCGVIGNPRFESLSKFPISSINKALVNVNFTYGIFESSRDNWVEDVVSSCEEVGFSYLISQHPRDSGELSKYNVVKSNASLVHSLIVDSAVVISRFSALLTESIILGRPCIYYNPHNENMFYNFTADNEVFFYAKSRDELILSLVLILDRKGHIEENSRAVFLSDHLGVTMDGKSSSFIADALLSFRNFPSPKKISWLHFLIVRIKLMKLRIFSKSF